jgi:hypothetical protein
MNVGIGGGQRPDLLGLDHVSGGCGADGSHDGCYLDPQTAAEANAWTSVTYGNGLFVAVSANGRHRVMTSGALIPPPTSTTTTTAATTPTTPATTAAPVAVVVTPSFTG